MLSEKECLTLFMFSFFLGELEKCLEDPEKLGSLFVKHVSANVFYGQALVFLPTNTFFKNISMMLRKWYEIFLVVRGGEIVRACKWTK